MQLMYMLWPGVFDMDALDFSVLGEQINKIELLI